MKHLLILISLILLSSPVIGDNHKGETLYRWETSSGETKIKVWKGFGDKETHSVYKGEVENGVPNGFGILIHPPGGRGKKYVGSWKNGKRIEGTITFRSGNKYVGEFKDDFVWNGTLYDKDGNIIWKFVNGKLIKQ